MVNILGMESDFSDKNWRILQISRDLGIFHSVISLKVPIIDIVNILGTGDSPGTKLDTYSYSDITCSRNIPGALKLIIN